MRALAFLLLIAAPTAVAAPVPKELKKSDMGLIVGVWEPIPANKSTWRFDADGKAAILNQNAPSAEGIKFAIDQTAQPKTFDWITTWGEWYGVYDLDGDKLTIYISRKDANKGRNLERKAGPGIEVYSFKKLPK